MLTTLNIQNIFEQSLGFWLGEAMPQAGHLMIISGRDYHVDRIIWDMGDADGAPYGAAQARIIVSRCDGKNEKLPADGAQLQDYQKVIIGDPVLVAKAEEILRRVRPLPEREWEPHQILLFHSVGAILDACGNSYANAYTERWLRGAKAAGVYHGAVVGNIAELAAAWEEWLEAHGGLPEMNG